MSDRLVILLHGVGSDGANMAGLGDAWAGALPRTTFVAPNAPDRFNAGYAWFSIVGVTEDNRPARVEAARPVFDATLNEIIAQAGFTDRLDRVALVGFSQGSIMALDALASGRLPVGAVVAFSGRLAAPISPPHAGSPRLFITHGTADPVVPIADDERAARELTAAGYKVMWGTVAGLGHSIVLPQLEAAVKFAKA